MSLCLAHTHSCMPIHILADFTAFCFPGRTSSCCRKITVKGGKKRTTEVQLSCLACSKRGGAVGVRNHFCSAANCHLRIYLLGAEKSRHKKPSQEFCARNKGDPARNGISLEGRPVQRTSSSTTLLQEKKPQPSVAGVCPASRERSMIHCSHGLASVARSLHRPGRNPSPGSSVWRLFPIVNPSCH